MKVESINTTPIVSNIPKVNSDKKLDDKEKTKESPAAIYEKGENRKNTGHVYDKTTVDKLKRDSEKAYAHLKRIVEDMLKRQGKTLKLVEPDEFIEVDETARLEAQELIGPDGALGVEAVSQRIVDFAIAISGGDKSKLDTLKKAINQGFKEAEKILGELPDISKQTYDRIMEKLDNWEKEE